MKSGLLDFYKSSIQIDPEVSDEEIKKTLDLANIFQGVTGLDYLFYVFSTTTSNLQNYKVYHKNAYPGYFNSVSGNKVIKVGEYVGVIDLWYPREVSMFNLVQNPICAGWVIQDLMGKMEKLKDIIKFSDPASTLNDSINKLLSEIEGTEFYGFCMWDDRNSGRKKPIKIRRLEVEKINISSSYYYGNLIPDMTMKDKDSKEELAFSSYNIDGWSFYLSKELLASRLKDLESFWMRDYDTKVKALDGKIKLKKKELENLINEREKFENGIDEYQKKLHDVLWKSF